MAKISTYPLDGSPNLGDKLIGTDIDNLNATKNYTIGQILSVPGSSTYVPYTGATANVNLGSNNITANSFVKVGGLSTQFLKADGSIDSTNYLSAVPTINQVLAAGNTATDKDLIINTTGVGSITVDGTTIPKLKITATANADTEVQPGNISIESLSLDRKAELTHSAIIYYDTASGQYTEVVSNPANFTLNTLEYPSGTGTFAISVNGVAAAATGNVELYKEYVALITVVGGNVTATVLKNTLGTTITWANPSNGLITALAGLPVFTSGKTWMSSGSYNASSTPYFITAEESVLNPGDELLYNVFLHDGTQASTPTINNFSIEIRVYP